MRNIHYMTSPQEWPEPPMDDCPECSGIGTIIVMEFTGMFEHKSKTCPVCHGTGQVEVSPPAPSSEDGEYERARLRSKMPEGWD